MSARDAIFILGSGRSGSSAITRVLSLCGCTLPAAVFGADEGNPRGFWEPVEAANLNLEFLLRNDWMAAHPSVRIRGQVSCNRPDRESYITKIRNFLSNCPEGPVLVIKDPLINEVMEFWFEAARLERFGLKAVILVRHPHEVFTSVVAFSPTIGLAERSLETSCVSWVRTNLLVERYTRNIPRVFVDYSNLMSDWRVEVNRVSRELDVEIDICEGAVDGFLTRGLHRQKFSGPPIDAFGYAWAAETYEILADAARGAPVNTVALDEIYRVYSTSSQALIELRNVVNLFAYRDYFARRPIWTVGQNF